MLCSCSHHPVCLLKEASHRAWYGNEQMVVLDSSLEAADPGRCEDGCSGPASSFDLRVCSKVYLAGECSS